MDKINILKNPVFLEALNNTQKTWTSIEIEYLMLLEQGYEGLAQAFLIGVLLDSYMFFDDGKKLKEPAKKNHDIPLSHFIGELIKKPKFIGVYKRYFKSYLGPKINHLVFDYTDIRFSYRGPSFNFGLFSSDISGFFRWYDNKLRKDSLWKHDKDPAFFSKLHKVESNKITKKDLNDWLQIT